MVTLHSVTETLRQSLTVRDWLNMAWGHELWDCYDKISSHVSSGVSTNLASYNKFFKEKAEIEKEYAKGLRKLVSKYERRGGGESDAEQWEEERVFNTILTETGYIAGQHEMIAENISHNIVKVRTHNTIGSFFV